MDFRYARPVDTTENMHSLVDIFQPISIDCSAAPIQPLDMDCSPGALDMGCSPDALDMGCSTDISQPLSIDCSMTYSLDMNLFVGDVNQPALMLPWQQQSADQEYTSLPWQQQSADQEYTSLPWQQQLTWEQTEIVDIIGEDYLY